MGGVDVGTGGSKKRALNSDINMIPFIDLLMVTIAFLLITAVWVSNSRMNANAQIPGPPDPEQPIDPKTPEKLLHLHIGDADFTLVWKAGATVVSETKLPKPEAGADVVKYSDLAKKIGDEWKVHGAHQDASDKKLDQCVLHVDNRLPFKEIVGVLDALYETKRKMKVQEQYKMKPVFNMTFSVR
ncbi:MAG: biopolymer transporter ExbD [Deltaproteobacteria bacterium]|nr:biopolymer transporter ExbD [Deltaproteobacteria bacterium]